MSRASRQAGPIQRLQLAAWGLVLIGFGAYGLHSGTFWAPSRARHEVPGLFGFLLNIAAAAGGVFVLIVALVGFSRDGPDDARGPDGRGRAG